MTERLTLAPAVAEEPHTGGWTEQKTRIYTPESFLTGRYEFNGQSGVRMRVDYAIDPTLTPGKYGRFYSAFVSRFDPQDEIEYARIMLGPYIADPRSDEPMIFSGNFDFTKDDNQEILGQLLTEDCVIHEVVWVLQDVLQLSKAGRLQRGIGNIDYEF